MKIGGELRYPETCWWNHAQYYAQYEQQQIPGDSAKYYQVKFMYHLDDPDEFFLRDHFRYDSQFSYYAYFNSKWYKWENGGWTAVSDTEWYVNDNRNHIKLKDALNKLPH